MDHKTFYDPCSVEDDFQSVYSVLRNHIRYTSVIAFMKLPITTENIVRFLIKEILFSILSL